MNTIANLLTAELIGSIPLITPSTVGNAFQEGQVITFNLSSLNKADPTKTIVFSDGNANVTLRTFLAMLIEEGTDIIEDKTNKVKLSPFGGKQRNLHQYLTENNLPFPEFVTVKLRACMGAQEAYLTGANAEAKVEAYKLLEIDTKGKDFPFISVGKKDQDRADAKNYRMRTFPVISLPEPA
jgi:hypothetical protein